MTPQGTLQRRIEHVVTIPYPITLHKVGPFPPFSSDCPFPSKALNDLNLTFPLPAVDWTPEDGYPHDAPADGFPWRPKGNIVIFTYKTMECIFVWLMYCVVTGIGTHHGLTLVLDANIEEYYCASTKSAGFKVKVTSESMSRLYLLKTYYFIIYLHHIIILLHQSAKKNRWCSYRGYHFEITIEGVQTE